MYTTPPPTAVSTLSLHDALPICRPDLPGLGKRPGFADPAASGCVPSLNHRKGMAMTIVETRAITGGVDTRSEEHTSELQSLRHLVCRLLLEKKKKTHPNKQELRQ